MNTAPGLQPGQAVFISYSSVDQRVAEAVAAVLDRTRVPYFLHKKDIDWGSHVTARVQEGLADCAAVIVIISPASLKSHWVPFEVGHAMGTGKLVLPFLVHPSLDLPGYLADLHYATDLQQVETYLCELNTRGIAPSADVTRFGPFSGQYIAYTRGADGGSVLVEEVRCRQVTQRLEGSIQGVAHLTLDARSGRYSETVANAGIYRFTGFIDQRVFVLSYQTTIAEQHNSGVIALKVDASGAFCQGTWAGLVGDSIATADCTWVRLVPPIDPTASRARFIEQASEYLARQPGGRSWVDEAPGSDAGPPQIRTLKATTWARDMGGRFVYGNGFFQRDADPGKPGKDPAG
jgi:hypothetical protein